MADDKDQQDKPETGDEGKGGKEAVLADLANERRKRQALEQQIADLKPLADKAKEIEDAKKDEVDRLKEQVAALTKERDDATSTSTRYKVALEKGLTLTRAKRLVGSNEEELAADADELLADLGEAAKAEKPGPASKPKENLRPGTNTPDAEPEETDLSKIGARMFNH